MPTKVVYCSECGERIPVLRKAVKAAGRIIEIISPHECSEEIHEIDLTPLDIPVDSNGKFVDYINALKPTQTILGASGNAPVDRRPSDQVKSTAPPGIFNNINHLPNQSPAHLDTDFSGVDDEE